MQRPTKSSKRFASNRHSASRHRWSLPDRLGHDGTITKKVLILSVCPIPWQNQDSHISSKCANRRMTMIKIRHHKTVTADVNKNHTVVPNKKSSSCRWLQWPWYECKEDYTSYGHVVKKRTTIALKTIMDNLMLIMMAITRTDGKGDFLTVMAVGHPEQLDAGWSQGLLNWTYRPSNNRTQCPSRKQTRGCHEIPNWIAKPTPGWRFSSLHFSKKKNIRKLQ